MICDALRGRACAVWSRTIILRCNKNVPGPAAVRNGARTLCRGAAVIDTMVTMPVSAAIVRHDRIEEV